MSEQAPRRDAAGHMLAGLVAIALVISLAACAAPAVSMSPPAPVPSGAIDGPVTSGPATEPPTATSGPSATSGPATSGPSAPIVVDPTLLAVLPTQVDGVALEPAAGAAGEMIRDPALAASASGVAVALAATGNATRDDFASVSVVRLRPGTYGEPFFADWRRSYDEAACAPAGGVASHARQVIGARTVEVTVCNGGARTLHTHLAGDVLVSITAVGDRRFGDLVMAGLRE